MPTLEELLIGSRLEDLSDEELEVKMLENRKARRNIMETRRQTKAKEKSEGKGKAKPFKLTDLTESKNTEGLSELANLVKGLLGGEEDE